MCDGIGCIYEIEMKHSAGTMCGRGENRCPFPLSEAELDAIEVISQQSDKEKEWGGVDR